MGCCEAEKVAVGTDKAPRAIGPYSLAVKAGPFVFASGQAGLDPTTNELVPGGVEAETRQTLANLKNIFEAAGVTMDHVVKTTIFLRDINDFARVNAVYAEFFSGSYPARSTVQVAALPKGAAVEIEAVAYLPQHEE
jgi:2-iminobutanoate/2-iminopropanoate deaminase